MSSSPPVATGPDIVPAPPEPGSADEVAQQIDDIYAPLKRFRATFKQQYKAKIAGITKDSTGVVIVVRPNKLSFRYDPPNNNRVVSDGNLIRVYEAENAQMFQQPLAATEYPGAFAFIMGKGLRPSFTFTFNDKAKWDGGPVIVGKPREPNPAYDSVLFYIDKALLMQKQPAAIRRVLVTDAQGNRNRFDFVEMSEPGEVSDDEFKFEPPPGTEIIKP
ncbi:MAG: outer membrane lipoprotein carrier protein LolA [Polyangiaceae bacterium]|nr:outer membrane lipoprotein carrier protein LolA [Polyangiaceae bacterium]